jgi:hypothetical protein
MESVLENGKWKMEYGVWKMEYGDGMGESPP